MAWIPIKPQEVTKPEMDSSDVLGTMAEIGLPILGAVIGTAFGAPTVGAGIGYTLGQYAKAGLADDPRESMRHASQGTQGLLTTTPYAWDAYQDYQKNIIPAGPTSMVGGDWKWDPKTGAIQNPFLDAPSPTYDVKGYWPE